MCDVNGVASPKFLGGKYFYLKRATVFCLGHHLTKLKMTRYARNFFFNFWWRQLAESRSLNCASCRGGWGKRSFARSATGNYSRIGELGLPGYAYVWCVVGEMLKQKNLTKAPRWNSELYLTFFLRHLQVDRLDVTDVAMISQIW